MRMLRLLALCAICGLSLWSTGCGGGDGLTPVIGLPPTITQISPSLGSVSGGTSVTITGTNFTSLITVSIGGNLCLNVNVANSTTLSCTTPPGTVGARDVQVATATGSATLPGGYTYANALVLGDRKFPVVDLGARDEHGRLVALLLDILNPEAGAGEPALERRPPVIRGDETLPTPDVLRPERLARTLQEAAGYHFGVDAEIGLVFWYDDLAAFLAGHAPRGWILHPDLLGADSIEARLR